MIPMESPSSPSWKLTFHCPPDYNIPIGDGHRYIIIGVDESYESIIVKQKSSNARDYHPDSVFSKSSSPLLSPLSTPMPTSLSEDSLLAPIFASKPNKVADVKDSSVYIKKSRKKIAMVVVEFQN